MRLDDEIIALYNNSRAAYHRGDIDDAETFYRRLRAEHGVEIFYEVELPDSWRGIHPIGTCIGRAEYHGHLVFYHGCGIGSDFDGNRPTIGNGVVLFPGAKVLGKTVIGDNVFVTANTVISGTSKRPLVIPDNSVVFNTVFNGYSSTEGYVDRPSVRYKKTTRSVIKYYFP